MAFSFKYLHSSFDSLELGNLAPGTTSEYDINISHDELSSIEIDGVYLSGSGLNQMMGWNKKWPDTGIAISFPNPYGDYVDYIWVTEDVGCHYSKPLPSGDVEWNGGYILSSGGYIESGSSKQHDFNQVVIGNTHSFSHGSYVKLAVNPQTKGIHVGALDTFVPPKVEIYDKNEISIYKDGDLVYGRLQTPLLNEMDFTGITYTSSFKVFFYYNDGIEKPYTFNTNTDIIIRATEDVRTQKGDELKIKLKIVVPTWIHKIETINFNMDVQRK